MYTFGFINIVIYRESGIGMIEVFSNVPRAHLN